MLDKLNSLSGRAKLLMLATMVVLTPLAAWAGYQVGYSMGAH